MQITTIAEPDDKPLCDLDPRTMVPGVVLQPQEYEVRFLLRRQSKIKWIYIDKLSNYTININ